MTPNTQDAKWISEFKTDGGSFCWIVTNEPFNTLHGIVDNRSFVTGNSSDAEWLRDLLNRVDA